jgi:hypothetical protein
MKRKSLSALVVAATVALSGAALAQSGDPVAVLASQAGNVSVSSNGSTFAGAATGQGLLANDRLMLVEGSSATLRFDDGCTVSFDKPGVYTVPSDCKAGVVGTDWKGAGIIATGVAVVAGVLASADNVPPPPESR